MAGVLLTLLPIAFGALTGWVVSRLTPLRPPSGSGTNETKNSKPGKPRPRR